MCCCSMSVCTDTSGAGLEQSCVIPTAFKDFVMLKMSVFVLEVLLFLSFATNPSNHVQNMRRWLLQRPRRTDTAEGRQSWPGSVSSQIPKQKSAGVWLCLFSLGKDKSNSPSYDPAVNMKHVYVCPRSYLPSFMDFIFLFIGRAKISQTKSVITVSFLFLWDSVGMQSCLSVHKLTIEKLPVLPLNFCCHPLKRRNQTPNAPISSQGLCSAWKEQYWNLSLMLNGLGFECL